MPTRPPTHRPAWWRPPAETRREQLASLERRRGTAKERGYDAEWRRLRTDFLVRNPLCLHCEVKGRAEPATEVHHHEPIRVRPDLRLVEANLRPLCTRCHSLVTQAETRRYGPRRAGP